MNKSAIIELKGKRVAITGSTGGLGRQLCFKLASFGAELILLDRNPVKADALQSELEKSFKGLKITRIITELEDISSVKNAVDKLTNIKPHYFIANAGAYSIPRHTCTTGYDNVFQINFISPYYMARKLYENSEDIKIIAVGSIAYTYSKINLNDVDFKTENSSAKAYGNAKRFLMLSLHEFFKGRDNLSIVHPGITFTNITAHYPPIIFAIIKEPMKVIFMKPKKACLSILEGLFKRTPYGFWIGPKLFGIWGKPKLQKLAVFRSEDSKKARAIAEKIYSKLN